MQRSTRSSSQIVPVLLNRHPHHRSTPYQRLSSCSLLTNPQFDGESDTRGPLDFSSASPGKLNDIADGDDDDLDDDDALDPLSPPSSR